MISSNNSMVFALLLLFVNACGSAPMKPGSYSDASVKESGPDKALTSDLADSKSTTNKIVDSNSSKSRSGATDNGASVACSYSINGSVVSGSSKQECDKLKKDFDQNNAKVPATPVVDNAEKQPVCSFAARGEVFEGYSQAECEQLKIDLGLAPPPFPEFPEY